ncbi:uncharacterized protein TNCV_1469701 [Trichonephila clavipes]|nr:uncharacterized protein TNCV_1469701 [Trichonephila clavipes]
MIPAYNKMRCAAFPFKTGIHFRRKTDFFPEDTTKSYSGFEPEPTRLQAEGHSHHTGWATTSAIVGIVSIGKLPDLDAFNRGQIVGLRRMGNSISELVRQLGFSRSTVSRVYQEHMCGWRTKTSNRTNCNGQLVLTVCGNRRFRRIVRSQRS